MKYRQTLLQNGQIKQFAEQLLLIGQVQPRQAQFYFEQSKKLYENYLSLLQKKEELIQRQQQANQLLKSLKDREIGSEYPMVQNQYRVKCKIRSCGKIMRSQAAYQKHMKKHTNKGKKGGKVIGI